MIEKLYVYEIFDVMESWKFLKKNFGTKQGLNTPLDARIFSKSIWSLESESSVWYGAIRLLLVLVRSDSI